MQKVRLILSAFSITLVTSNSHGNESGMVLIPAGELNVGKSTRVTHLGEVHLMFQQT